MPHDSYPPAQQNSRKCRAKSTSPSSDHRKDTVFREFFRDLLMDLPPPSTGTLTCYRTRVLIIGVRNLRRQRILHRRVPSQSHRKPQHVTAASLTPHHTLPPLRRVMVPRPYGAFCF